jgi:opacity protein-like surface antigen
MTESTLHRIAIAVVALALGSAVMVPDAVAAGGHAGAGGGDGHFSGAIVGDRFGGGFGASGLEHGHYGRRGLAVPFGYYDDYGDYGAYSNNGCRSLDAYGCEE